MKNMNESAAVLLPAIALLMAIEVIFYRLGLFSGNELLLNE